MQQRDEQGYRRHRSRGKRFGVLAGSVPISSAVHSR
jgi:hypothetical protein